jgi:hypothetical protein
VQFHSLVHLPHNFLMAEIPGSSDEASSIISEDDDDDNNNSDGSSDRENHDPNVENVIPQEMVCAALLLIKSQPLKKAMWKVRTKKKQKMK